MLSSGISQFWMGRFILQLAQWKSPSIPTTPLIQIYPCEFISIYIVMLG